MSNNSNNQVNGLAHEYIKHLEDELKKAENNLKINTAYYNSAASAYNDITIWRDKLKRYFDNIKETNNLATRLTAELTKLDIQTNRAAGNAQGNRDAVLILLCSVKEIAMVLEEMSGQLTDLWRRIECVTSKDPVLDFSKSVLKILSEFKAKLEATLTAALSTLNLTLALLKSARLLLDEKRAVQSYTTWLWEVGGVVDTTALQNGGMPMQQNVDAECWGTADQKSMCEVSYESPCGNTTVVPPKIDIKGSEYYIRTECQLNGTSPIDPDSAENKWKKMQQEKDKAQGILDSTLAKKEAANKALNEAKNAKKCI